MAILRIRLEVTLDGQPLTSAPFVRRIELADNELFAYTQAVAVDPDTFTALPVTAVATLSAFLLLATDTTTLRMGDLALQPGALVLVLGGQPAAVPQVNVAAADGAQLAGLAGGA